MPTCPGRRSSTPRSPRSASRKTEAKAEEIDHRVYKVAYDELDRARIDGRTEGFAKVIASPSGKILGATILGEEASLVLQQLVVAMDAGLGLGDLVDSTQIYPTYGADRADLADQYQATRLERGFSRAALKLLLRVPAPDGSDQRGLRPRRGADPGRPRPACARGRLSPRCRYP